MDHEGKTSDDLILTRWVMDFQQAELGASVTDGQSWQERYQASLQSLA